MNITKDWKLKPVQENNEQDWEDDDEEDQEALSLCDLASDDYWGTDEFSKEDIQDNSFDDQEMFEFFSVNEDFSASASPKNDNIIFCGKLIPYKGEKEGELLQEQSYQEKISSDRSKDQTTKKISSKLFSWKSFSLNRSRSTSSLKIQQEKSYRTCKTFPESSSSSENKSKNGNCDFPMKKVSLLSSSSKSRWYLFAFGVGKYPMEIKLSDIKTRQSKNPARIFRSDGSRELADPISGKREKGNWWGLFGNFGCKSSHANAMVKASLGCIA